MIVPQELRIGNFIYHKDNPLPQKVDGLDSYKIQTEYISEYSKPEEFEPIPLTEELLVKAGFECLSHYDGEVMNVSFSRDGIILTIENDEFDFIGVPVKYLHKLQNLFYEITGTELTIKL